jgi:thioesterase domain-containing protein/acyl carrier protein
MMMLTASTPAPSSAPRDETTDRLTGIWQKLLGIESIGLGENYFDLGGDSILAVQLFAKIHEEFNVKLPVSVLFEAPTIEELAIVLRRETPSASGSPLVAIQPAGSRPPFFCMHGAGGNVLIYRDLSRRLGNDQPFYGLQSRGLDGHSQPLSRVEDMAALYVGEIRKVQGHGPYYLGGYCGGGTIAFEVAQQLCAEGERVALLALFDTCNWSKVPPLSVWDKCYFAVERIIFHAANFVILDSEGKAEFLKEKVRVLRHRMPVWWGQLMTRLGPRSRMNKSESRLLAEIWRANDRACATYVPKSYRGGVTDFRPVRQYRIFNQPDLKWDEIALGGQTVVTLPAYPAGMLVEPIVRHLAEALKKFLNLAVGGAKQP